MRKDSLTKVIKLPLLTILLFMSFLSDCFAEDLPNAEMRVKIFDRIVSELERIDGEGLIARMNRPEKWKETVAKLRESARLAQTQVEFGQVFRRLDATYPNLHAQVVLDEKFDIAAGRLRPKIGVRFGAEIINPKQKNFTYKINSIETDMMKEFRESTRPAIGDEVLAINGKPMSEWSQENFIYCKFPFLEQCEANIFDHFRKAFLSWNWNLPLEYQIKRNGRVWSIKVPVEIPKPTVNTNTQSQSGVSNKKSDCPVEADRYEGFKPVFKGLNICAYESTSAPNVTVLRIESFRYRELPKESKVQSLKDEVEQFYQGYWKVKSPTVKKLIIDLIDNGGGDTPIPWYQIFYVKPFQEQYVQFKKLVELDNDQIRKDLFYEDSAKEIWFADLKKSAAYQKIKAGDFVPQIPQFCASEDLSCDKGLYEVRPHGFKGEVRLMVNEWCVSTCTGFVWSIKDQLGKRVKVIGMPDSGDSAYARLYIDLYLDSKEPEGFRTEVSPRVGRTRQNLPDGAVLRQQVTATRSTDSKGRIISAIPVKVDSWVPYEYRHFDDTWEAKVFKKALRE